MRASRARPILPVELGRAGDRGKWIVLVNDAVVDSDRDLCACMTRVRAKHPGQEPLVLKIPLSDRRGGPRPRPR